MISTDNQRVGVFIDIQNMYYSAKALFGQKVDFGKVLERAVGERRLIRGIAYVIRAENEQEQPFFESLKKRGLEIRAKALQTFYGGNKKGDWDVGIAMDVMRLAAKLDVVVLVSGDGDFADLLKHVKALGCRAEVMAFGPSSSSLLRAETDEFIDLAELKEDILINTNPLRRRRPNTVRR
ncbi:MAG: NYN domain-containing protein [Candidatus Kerfeldbacteria bacterium]|nr:NYN domain-containing protein [Candidatus Kerfeldbacteria bacterium]